MTAVRTLSNRRTAPYAELITVTPDLAADWLELNAKNRNLRSKHVQRLARDMAAGHWLMTGEAIKFARSGALLDGQHRLAAVVESGASVPMMVVYNLPEEAQSAMDSGSARTASDALGLLGIKNSAISAAAARLAIAEQRGEQIGKFSTTHAEVIAFLEAHPEMAEAVDFASWAYKRVDCPPAIIAFTLWRLAGIDSEEAYVFWGGVTERLGIRAGDPINALANRLAQARRNSEYLSREALVSLIFRAWNLRRAGKTAQRMPVTNSAGGLIPVPVPR